MRLLKKLWNRDVEDKKAILFLNKPISNYDKDIIGVTGYVERIVTAILNGAQMIAIVSDFAGGKSSIIEMLKKRIQNKKYKLLGGKGKRKVRIMTLNLWSEIEKDEKEFSTIDLHKKMMFQMMHGMNRKRGSFIQKRLSGNYGVFRISSSGTKYTVFGVIFLVVTGIVSAYKYFEFSKILYKVNQNVAKYIDGIGLPLLIIFDIILLIVLAFKSDVIFSIKAKRDVPIDENEIINLYYKYVIYKKRQNYIFVIEDLDRCENVDFVHKFLTELRKYYVPNDNKKYAMVTFIVNIKPESEMRKLTKKPELYTDFYTKIFEQIIHINKVNVDNYDVILEQLLEEQQPLLENMFICDKNRNVKEFIKENPGLNWIIYGKTLSIRLVKERLNRCFSIYESLKEKFSYNTSNSQQNLIDINKCAVVAYLETEYSDIMLGLNDKDFEKIVEKYAVGKINKADEIPLNIDENKKEFINDIYVFLKSKYIDNTYRMYFYNYPKESYLFTSTENAVYNAILYNETITDTLHKLIGAVERESPDVFDKAFKKLIDLSIGIRENILDSSILYFYAIRYFSRDFIDMLHHLDYGTENFSWGTLNLIKQMIGYGFPDDIDADGCIIEYCKVWSKECTAEQIILIREMICTDFTKEIHRYYLLYGDLHPLITNNEIELINDIDIVLKLLAYKSPNYNITTFRNIHNIVMQQFEPIKYQDFYKESIQVLDLNEIWNNFLEYMYAVNEMIPELDEKIIPFLIISSEEEKKKYVKWLFQLSLEVFTERVIGNLMQINYYDGISLNICDKMYDYGKYSSYLMVMGQYYQEEIEFSDRNIISAFEDNSQELYENYEDMWMDLRTIICKSWQTEMRNYSFLFTNEYPFISLDEMNFVDDVEIICEILQMYDIPEDSNSEIETVVAFFSKKERTRIQIMTIYKYLSTLSAITARNIFYKLDQENIRYSKLSKADKQRTKSMLQTALELGTVKGILKFVTYTRIPDRVYDVQLKKAYDEEIISEKEFGDCLNSLKSISDLEFKCILAFPEEFVFSKVINKKLFEKGKYIKYVLSKILGEQKFEYTEEEYKILKSVYIVIFNGDYSKEVKNIMSRNRTFLTDLYEDNFYNQIEDEDTRSYFTVFLQTQECLKDLVQRFDFTYIVTYLSNILGFENEEASSYFIDLAERYKEIASNQQVYNNTYDKLVSPSLKGRLTKAKNKYSA